MKIESNKQLKDYNTFGIQAEADYFAEVTSLDDLDELMESIVYRQNKKLILGGGSNILLKGSFNGLIIKNSILGISVESENETSVIVTANAGEEWDNLILYCNENKYAGIENLSLIPGSVGAAPMQNIGAYGVEIKDVFYKLEAVDMESGSLVRFNLKDCKFGYRESIFKQALKGKYFITSVSFKLAKLSSDKTIYAFKTEYGDLKNTLNEMQVFNLTLKAVSDAVCKIRRSKLPNPKELGNAGSFFKNPTISKDQYEKLVLTYPVIPCYPQKNDMVKIPAGWLIEQCGWKGKVVGNTGSHHSQALVLVNYGNATGQEIWDLAMQIQLSVKEKFGIEILPEVNVF